MAEAVIQAERAADAVRALNDATVAGDGGLADPANLYDCVNALALLAERLPQTLEQVGRIAKALATRDGLYDARDDRNPSAVARAAAALLDDTDPPNESPIRLLADDLRSAANRLSHLGVRDD